MSGSIERRETFKILRVTSRIGNGGIRKVNNAKEQIGIQPPEVQEVRSQQTCQERIRLYPVNENKKKAKVKFGKFITPALL